MWELSLSNLWARKFRLLSTSLSVLVGVAFLAGSLVLLDTIGRTFDDLFATINEELDAVVRSDETIETQFGDIRGRIDQGLVDTVAAVDGVAAAEGSVEGFAQLVKPDGTPLGNPGQGAPTLGFNWSEIDALNPMNLVEGRAPSGPDEVAIDRLSAKNGPFAIGDTVTVLLQGPPRSFRVGGNRHVRHGGQRARIHDRHVRSLHRAGDPGRTRQTEQYRRSRRAGRRPGRDPRSDRRRAARRRRSGHR